MRNFKVYYRVYVAGRWQKATKIVQGKSVDDAVKNADLWVNLISRVEMIELVTK